MGFLDRIGLGRKPRTVLASRSFVFPDMKSAQSFQAAAQAGGSRFRGSAWDSYGGVMSLASQYGGEMYRSTYGRELRVYGYQQRISDADRDYLFNRDPTAAMFVEKPFADMWNGMPLTYTAEVDSFFSDAVTKGLLAALQAAYQEYYQRGGGFILLETDGDPSERLRRGERPMAWCFVPAHLVIDDDNPDTGYLLANRGNVDPLLDHGVEYLWLYPTESAKANGEPTRVHGSRLIPVNLDPRKQRWWRTPNVPLDRIYDTLWELRDIIFSRARAHFQGDPIVVDVDITQDAQALLNIASMSDAQKTAVGQMVEQSIVDYQSGAKSTFAPVMGFKMRRLGAAQLPDPKEDVMMLSSRLSHGSVFPVKMVLASTKGAADVSDQDILLYAGNIQNIRNTWGYKHLAKVLLMGQVMGANGLRMQGTHDLPNPQDMEWPLLRPLSPRDSAFVQKTDATMARELQEASFILPARLRRKFAPDPARPLPLWLASRGRGEDGKSKDPPKQAGAFGADAMAAVEDAVEAEVERVLESKAEAEWPENDHKAVVNRVENE